MKTAVIYDKWLNQLGGGEVVACQMACALRKNNWNVMLLTGKPASYDEILKRFAINLNSIPLYEVWNDEQKLKNLVKGKDLFINTSFMDYSYGYAKTNIYYTHFPTPVKNVFFNTVLYLFLKTNLHALFPKATAQRIQDRIRAGIFFDMHDRLTSYDLILANSRFSQKWIGHYWGESSKILYPPVSSNRKTDNPNEIKKPWICHIGRFFTLGHGKKQEILIDAFKKLYDTSKNNSLELHLIGGAQSDQHTTSYINHLKQSCADYPVFFHVNCSEQEKNKILSGARIYWHATGFQENEQQNPMSFEHFGIAPIEAIEAGCIPLLYDGGGLPEIINTLNLPRQNHLFQTVDELVKKSKHILDNTNLTITRETKEKLEKNFSTQVFEINLLQSINSLASR